MKTSSVTGKKPRPRFSVSLITGESAAPRSPSYATEAELNAIAPPPAPCRPNGAGYPGVSRMMLMTGAMIGDGKDETLMGTRFALRFFGERESWAPASYAEWVSFMEHRTEGARGPVEMPRGLDIVDDAPLGLRNPHTLVRAGLMTYDAGNPATAFRPSVMLVQAYATIVARYPKAARELQDAQNENASRAVAEYHAECRAEGVEPNPAREIEVAWWGVALTSADPNHPQRRGLPVRRKEENPVDSEEESGEPPSIE